MSRSAIVPIATAWAAASLLSGCGGSAPRAGTAFRDEHPLPLDTMTVAVHEPGTYGGRFVIGATSAPKTFNAIMSNESSTTDVTQRMFVGLQDFDYETQKTTAMLAKSWDVSPDGRTWTWHLRRGLAFSDGHPITSADVIFSFDVVMDSTLHPVMQDGLTIGGRRMEYSAPDSYTVVTKIVKPYALMGESVSSVPIMPKHVLEPAFRAGNFGAAYSTSTPPDQIVTSGPFRLKEFVAGEKTVLARNPWWFGVDPEGHRLPYLDELVFLQVPDQNTAALKFQAGDLDGLDNVKPEDYKTYAEGQQKGGYTLHEIGPALTSYFLWFNLNTIHDPHDGRVGAPRVGPVPYAWFRNPDFRRAVSMAIDRDAIIRSVFYGDAVKNWSSMTPGNKTWFDDPVPEYDYAPEKAKALLAKIGFVDRDGDGVREDPQGHPIAFTIKTNSDNNVRVAMCNFVKDDLANVGIRVTPTPRDFNTLVTNIRQDFQYEAILAGLSSGVPPDPGMSQNVWKSSGLTHYWNIKQPRPGTPEEAQLDRLMDENVSTNDMAVRQRTWREMERIVNEQCWFVWLPTQVLKLPVRNRFGNVEPSVIPHRLLWNIDRVFVKKPGARA